MAARRATIHYAVPLRQPKDTAHQLRLCMLFRCSSASFELADRAVHHPVQNPSRESLDRPVLRGLERAKFVAIALKLRRSNLLQPLPNSDDGW